MFFHSEKWVEIQKILTSDIVDDGFFGSSVAITPDGNTAAIVGARSGNPSAIYLFTRSGSVWTEVEKITSNYSSHEIKSIAISSDRNTIAAGGGDFAGAVFLFTRSGSVWSEVEIVPNDSTLSDGFGTSVALTADGDTLLVGAPGADRTGAGNAGAVYIFKRTIPSGSSWSQVAKFYSNSIQQDEWLGTSVAITPDGNTFAVGATQNHNDGITNAGSVFIFKRFGVSWGLSAKIVPNTSIHFAKFGSSVALTHDGNTLLVGAYGEPAAYIFNHNDHAWSQVQRLGEYNEFGDDDEFGTKVAISSDGNIIAVGAPDSSLGASRTGAVYTFTRSGSTWTRDDKILVVSDASSNYKLGQVIAMDADGDTLIAGVRYALTNDGITRVGAAYFFRKF